MTAALIIIGDEILSGTTADTNSCFITGELNKIGIPVVQILSVSDNIDAIKKALAESFEVADFVISTGGLGPTKDDLTKTAFCEFFDDEVKLDPETLEHLRKLLEKRNRGHLLEINKAQAEVPSRAVVFQNFYGTAPSCLLTKNGKSAVFLPGVPYEVKPLIRGQIIPYLQKKHIQNRIVSRMVTVLNLPESLLSETIENWELSLPENCSLSYLPVASRVQLKLTANGRDETELNRLLDYEIGKLKPLIGDYIIAEKGAKLEEILQEILVKRNLTVSTAESCTGGEIARLITSVPGISEHFLGGVVCYHTDKKTEILGVSGKTIENHTVVSAEVAQEMTLGCQNLFKTDIAVSTTGVAGPGSDEFDNEIGKVFYSLRIGSFEKTRELFLPQLDRTDFMNFVSVKAIQDLIHLLINDYSAGTLPLE